MTINKPDATGCWLSAAAVLMVSISGQAAAALLNLPANPLFVSTSVKPNVMMIVDNSGSMDNVIWADGFDPSVSYPNYSPNCNFGGGVVAPCWSPLNGNVIRGNLPNGAGGCASDHLPGIRSGDSAFRCIRLPDVRGTLTRFNGNYINYLFETFSTQGMNLDVRSSVPNVVRLEVAKEVSEDIVVANPDVRFGISSFNPPNPTTGNNAPGGRVNAACGATQANVLSAVSGLTAESNTPLAETYYEVTRYFRGLSSFYNSNTNYASPIQYRCQKNFVIAVTDGFPTYDGAFPSNDPDDVANTGAALPNWDGMAPATLASTYPNFPQYSDGTTGLDQQPEGASLYLDDLAKFGFDIDLKNSGTDLTGGSYQDPDFLQQNLITYTVGFAVENQMMEDAAEYGAGDYYTASSAAELTAALQAALSDIAARAASFSSASLNSTSLNAGSRLFQAGFNSADWTGTLRAFSISSGADGACESVPAGQLCPGQAWEGSGLLDGRIPGDRVILTRHGETGAGIPFRWASLSTDQRNLLHRNPNNLSTADAKGEERLEYLRGDRTQESPTGFRVRGSVLGDIVNSDPFFVGPPTAALPFEGYSSFRASQRNRTPMVYVGANDGMLHGFRVSDGRETLAFVPSVLFGRDAKPTLAQLTANPYTHAWGVDGSPTAADVKIGAEWATYLVGSLRHGGQGLFALDVTNPEGFSESAVSSIVKWEFTDADDNDLGYTFSQPAIVRLNNGKWAAIIGNGYNNDEADGNRSSTRQASLFIIFLDGPSGSAGAWSPGGDYVKIPVGPTGQDNGLAGAAPVDVNGDGIIDYVFAGDLQGNMWQFNIGDENAVNWGVAYGNNPLFVARDPSGNRQPITTTPEIGLNTLTGDPRDLVVLFGTGRFIQTGDNSRVGQQTQTFYGIFADPINESVTPAQLTASSPNASRGELLEQVVEREVTLPDGQSGRVTSQNEINFSPAAGVVHKGWYIDLYNTNVGSVDDTAAAAGLNLGERQISRPILRFGRVVFTTIVPSDDLCVPDGSGWLMEIDARTGARPKRPVLDITEDLMVDNDDIFDEGDPDDPDDDVNISGIGSPDGMLSTPAVLSVNPDLEIKYSVRSNNTTAVIGEAAAGRAGRITWREIAP